MYKIADKYGSYFQFECKSYLLACHTAHWIRERGYDCGVVDCATGRFMSEVYGISSPHEIMGKAIATRLLAGDYESRLL